MRHNLDEQIFFRSSLNMTTDADEEFNDAAFFLIEVHEDLGEPKEQLGIEMERVCNLQLILIDVTVLVKCYILNDDYYYYRMTMIR